MLKWIWKNKSNHSVQENIRLFDCRRQLGLIVKENPVLLCSFLWLAKKLASPQPIRWKKSRVARVFPWLSLRVSSSQFPFLLDTCGSPVIKCLCFLVFFCPPPQNGKMAQKCPVVIGPSTPWQLTVIQWGVHMLITRTILMTIDVVMHRQGRVTWRITSFCF